MAAILVIEDEQAIRENICEILRLTNYTVFAAENGKVGVETALQENIDLIVSDIMMPYLDGFGVLHILRKHPGTRNIPFIFLSSKNEIQNLRQAMSLGANDYILKPFESSDLLRTIETQLSASRIPDTDGKTEMQPASGPADTVSAPEQTLSGLIETSESVDFRKKQLIYKEGSMPRFIYFIKSGKVRVFKSHEDGKDLVMGLHGEGDYIGYAPVIQNTFYTDTAEVTEDAEIVLLPRKNFEKIISQETGTMKKFIEMLSADFLEKEEQLLGAAYNTLRQKVAGALLILKKKYRIQADDFMIRVSRDELATIAGTATESLIRTLSEFRQEKLIEIKDGAILIKDEQKLVHLLR